MTDSTSSSGPSERRRAPRVRALHHTVITSDGDSAEVSVQVGRTLDVSETGVRIEIPSRLCIDDKVRLEIAIEETLVNAKGRVIRATRIGDVIEAGIEFTVIADEDRLALLRSS